MISYTMTDPEILKNFLKACSVFKNNISSLKLFCDSSYFSGQFFSGQVFRTLPNICEPFHYFLERLPSQMFGTVLNAPQNFRYGLNFSNNIMYVINKRQFQSNFPERFTLVNAVPHHQK